MKVFFFNRQRDLLAAQIITSVLIMSPTRPAFRRLSVDLVKQRQHSAL
jgi:hypothetical protein